MSKRIQRTFKPDALVVCNDGCVQAHSIVLSSIFGYFKTYYNTSMQTNKEIRIDFSRKSFYYLTDFLFYKDSETKHVVDCKNIAEIVRCAEFLITSPGDITEVILSLLGSITEKEHKHLGSLVPMYPEIINTAPRKFPIETVLDQILKDPDNHYHAVRKICGDSELCYKIWKSHSERVADKKMEINFSKMLKKAISHFTAAEIIDYYTSKMQSFVLAHDIEPCNELINNAFVLTSRIRKLLKTMDDEEAYYLIKLHEILITIADIDFDCARDNLSGHSSGSSSSGSSNSDES